MTDEVGTAAEVDARVVHVVRCYGTPSQTFIPDAIQELDRLGWEAWVVADAVEKREWFPFPPDERLLLGERPSLLTRVNGRAHRIPAYERRARWLLPKLALVRPALVHAHFGWAAANVMAATQQLQVPLIASFYGTDATVFGETKRGRMEYQRLFECVARVTVVSRFVETKIRSLGYRGLVDIVPPGVRLDSVPFRERLPDRTETRLLYVGRQVPVKGLDVLLRALPAVRSRRPDVRLDVIGDGPMRIANEALATDLGIAGWVRFHGVEAHQQVLARMRDADLVVAPSRTPDDGAADGSPVAVKEALAVGVPVVATTNGGIPEIIPPPYRDELAPEGNPEALAASILAVIADRENWPERVHVGREWVEAEFAWTALARRVARIYTDVLMARAGDGRAAT